MTRSDVEREYGRAAGLLRKHRLDVHIPQLRQRGGASGRGCGRGRGRGGYTVGALMLVFFATRVGRIATKDELVAYLRKHRCRTHDPQPRHMGMQLGLNFLVAGCWHPKLQRVLRRGEYCLLDLVRTHPSRATGINHRARGGLGAGEFDSLKSAYGNRCACCGSAEGQPHLKNALLVTSLERGHLDPRRPLTCHNCIPICRMCNMVYKDHAVLSRRGFVVSWHKAMSSSTVMPLKCGGGGGAVVDQVTSISDLESSESSESSAEAAHAAADATARDRDRDGKDGKPPGLLQRIRTAIWSVWGTRVWGGTPAPVPPERTRAIRRSAAFFGGGPMSLFD